MYESIVNAFSYEGLSEEAVLQQRERYGYHDVGRGRTHPWRRLLQGFMNPLVIVMLAVCCFSLFFGEWVNAALVASIVVMSVVLGCLQEHKASHAAESLIAMVRITVAVRRNNKVYDCSVRNLVPGDCIELAAGDMIPADCILMLSKDFFINQSVITGESFPCEKQVVGMTLADRFLAMGSSVVSGSAVAVVVATGKQSSLQALNRSIQKASSFDTQMTSFSLVMVKIMLLFTVGIGAIVVLRHGDIFEALFFALGVAIGVTPEMLPVVTTVALSKGAMALSKEDVIVKRLSSIHGLGSMDVLCSDKTGTLTEDAIILDKYCDINGREDEEVLHHAYINSFYQTGLRNVIDRAILDRKVSIDAWEKKDEIPFDFMRKMMSVVVAHDGMYRLIVKGSPEEVVARSISYIVDGVVYEKTDRVIEMVQHEYVRLSNEGFRVLAIAYKDVDAQQQYTHEDEYNLTLLGYLAFLDPPKSSARDALTVLSNLGIQCKILTGDGEHITRTVCKQVGLSTSRCITGDEIELMPDDALQSLVSDVSLFVRLKPDHKRRIVAALSSLGHTVGFLGDGINDALALQAAAVSISVNNAADIAKESADIILLQKTLTAVCDGVVYGRRTYVNIMKYMTIGSSSNIGNMLSMTVASLCLPFLPMLPVQILLNNVLYDISQIPISTDRVEDESIVAPQQWNMRHFLLSIIIFGGISSCFDAVFFVMFLQYQLTPAAFHTGWFIASLCTQTCAMHILRTQKLPFFEHAPSVALVYMTLAVLCTCMMIPYFPCGHYFGFVPLASSMMARIVGVTALYLCITHAAKRLLCVRCS